MRAKNALDGWLDLAQGPIVQGWAHLMGLPDDQATLLDIFLDGRLVDRVAACNFRRDLAEAGLGCFGFVWIVPEIFLDGVERKLQMSVTNGRMILPGSVTVVQCDFCELSAETRTLYRRRRMTSKQTLADELNSMTPPHNVSGGHDRPGGQHLRALRDLYDSLLDAVRVPTARLVTDTRSCLTQSELIMLSEGGRGRATKNICMKQVQVGPDGILSGLVKTQRWNRMPPVVDIIADGEVLDVLQCDPVAGRRNEYSFKWVPVSEMRDRWPHEISLRLSNTQTILSRCEAVVFSVADDTSERQSTSNNERAMRLGRLHGLDYALIDAATKPQVFCGVSATDLEKAAKRVLSTIELSMEDKPLEDAQPRLAGFKTC